VRSGSGVVSVGCGVGDSSKLIKCRWFAVSVNLKLRNQGFELSPDSQKGTSSSSAPFGQIHARTSETRTSVFVVYDHAHQIC
jgi:hypothetical protein